jgi:rhodanese-related sulfurtransferase
VRRLRPLSAGLLAVLALAAAGCSLLQGRTPEQVVAFSRVRPPVAFEMMRDNPGMPVIDLRTRYEFTGPAGHVRGAHNVPMEELPERVDDLLPLKDRTFLLYCGHDECGETGLAMLLRAGFQEVLLMEGGLDAWVMGGFGTVTGPPSPMSFERDGTTEIEVD